MIESETPHVLSITLADFRTRARRALDPIPSAPAASPHENRWRASDFDLDPGLAGPEWSAPAKPAAVLVPVVARPELTLLFTQRTDHLPSHAGQIAFPGGKIEDGDGSPLATALREAEEEIGLDRALVEPLGALDGYRTGTGYCITPILALIDPAFSPSPNPAEVVDVFEVPLPYLMNPSNHRTHVRTIGASERRFYAMPYGERFIWGATAGILKNMHHRLFGS